MDTSEVQYLNPSISFSGDRKQRTSRGAIYIVDNWKGGALEKERQMGGTEREREGRETKKGSQKR